jgi:starvation-inducible outer membrane lipoprotein
MKYYALLFFLLSGCVTIPIPPVGAEPGSLGSLEIQVMFHPNLINAVEKFNLGKENPKPTSSK